MFATCKPNIWIACGDGAGNVQERHPGPQPPQEGMMQIEQSQSQALGELIV